MLKSTTKARRDTARRLRPVAVEYYLQGEVEIASDMRLVIEDLRDLDSILAKAAETAARLQRERFAEMSGIHDAYLSVGMIESEEGPTLAEVLEAMKE